MKLRKVYRSSVNPKHMVSIIAAMIFIVAVMLLFDNNIASLGDYLQFLKSRNYNYSVIISNNLSEDTYVFYDRNITFSKNESLQSLMNCSTLMETQNAHTENDFLYGSDVSQLARNEIAISSNLARENGISQGDVIFSKNKYNDTVEEYKVVVILPEIYGIGKHDASYDQGIIVVGYDKEYLENVQSEYIYFYNEDYSLINESGTIVVGELNSVADTAAAITRKYVAYCGITIAIITLISIAFFALMHHFNSGVYQIRKQFGTRDLYRRICFDYGMYAGALIVASLASYLIGTIWVSFACEELLFLLMPVMIVAAVCLAITIRKVRRQ